MINYDIRSWFLPFQSLSFYRKIGNLKIFFKRIKLIHFSLKKMRKKKKIARNNDDFLLRFLNNEIHWFFMEISVDKKRWLKSDGNLSSFYVVWIKKLIYESNPEIDLKKALKQIEKITPWDIVWAQFKQSIHKLFTQSLMFELMTVSFLRTNRAQDLLIFFILFFV